MTPAKPRVRDSFVALRHANFRRFFFAALGSNSGAWLQGLASPWVIFRITDSGAWVGASVFALMLPMALMGPIAGPLADRVSRRTILLRTQPLLALIAVGFAMLWWTGVREPLAYVALGAVYGTVNGFSMPAWQAYVSDLVPRDVLPNAITLNSAQFNAARAVGPSIGGVVLATLGPGWCFALNGASFLFVVAALVTLPPTTATGSTVEPVLRQFRLGIAYARTQRGILTGYFAAGLVALCGGTLVQVHLVLFAEEVFSVGERWYGVMVSAFGLGAIVVTPWLTTFAPRYRRSHILVVGLAAYGVGELILTSTTSLSIGIAGIFIAGAAHITMATTTNSTLQLQTTESMRGRVMSMYLIVLTLGMPVGAIVEGPLADRFGPRPVVATMGTLLLLGATWLQASGRARSFDAEPDEAPRSYDAGMSNVDPIDPVGGRAASDWQPYVTTLDTPPTPWPPAGNLVVFAPHPDDEILPMGATLAAASDLGADITIVAVTDGGASHPHLEGSAIDDLIERRRAESEAAYVAASISANRVRLGLPDGAVQQHRQALQDATISLMRDADLVIAPLADDGHPDHDAVGQAVLQAAAQLEIPVVLVPIWSWNWRPIDGSAFPEGFVFPISEDLLARKRAAIACYVSQVAELQPDGRPGLPASFLGHFDRRDEVFFAVSPAQLPR